MQKKFAPDAQALAVPVTDLQIIIHKSNEPEAESHKHDQPHIDVSEICPKEHGKEDDGKGEEKGRKRIGEEKKGMSG